MINYFKATLLCTLFITTCSDSRNTDRGLRKNPVQKTIINHTGKPLVVAIAVFDENGEAFFKKKDKFYQISAGKQENFLLGDNEGLAFKDEKDFLVIQSTHFYKTAEASICQTNGHLQLVLKK